MQVHLLFIVIAFFTLLSYPAEGIQLALTDKDIQKAIQYGSKNKDLLHPELLKDWRIDLGYGVGSATLITPYGALIIMAKESALMFREPTGREIVHKLKEMEGKLIFGCSLYGDEIDFISKCKAQLEYKFERREPVRVELPPSGDYTTNYPAPPKFWALCFFHFDMKGIGPDDRVTLIVKDAKGRELKFPFDLSQLK